jgi:hypothetical protein
LLNSIGASVGILGIRQRQQAFALGGGQDRTAGHAVSFFLKT